ERLPHWRPLPLRTRAVVMIHAVEVRAPASARFGRDVLERREQRVGNEDLRAPALNGGVGFLGPAQDRCRLARLTIAVVVPRPPAEEPPLEVGNEDRELAIERRDLVLEVHGVALVG